jgi:hypothetical protein
VQLPDHLGGPLVGSGTLTTAASRPPSAIFSRPSLTEPACVTAPSRPPLHHAGGGLAEGGVVLHEKDEQDPFSPISGPFAGVLARALSLGRRGGPPA